MKRILAAIFLGALAGTASGADFSDFPYQPFEVAICQGYMAVLRDSVSAGDTRQRLDTAEKILFRANEERMNTAAAIQMSRVSWNILRHMLLDENDLNRFSAMELPLSTAILAPDVGDYSEMCFDAVERAIAAGVQAD